MIQDKKGTPSSMCLRVCVWWDAAAADVNERKRHPNIQEL
jgi:hypothetical protein